MRRGVRFGFHAFLYYLCFRKVKVDPLPQYKGACVGWCLRTPLREKWFYRLLLGYVGDARRSYLCDVACGYDYSNYQCITNAKEEFYEKIGSILSDANGQHRMGCSAE